MTIKYGEITIIRNLEQETFVSYYIIRKLFNREGGFTDNDNIVILFDDETIYDIKDDNNKNIIFKETDNIDITYFPLWFDIISKDVTAFYKYPTETPDGNKKLDFNTLTNNYRNKHKLEFVPSVYNIIYDLADSKKVFCIVKVKSSEDKPRFVVAYDDEYFDKNDIIYLVNCIFKLKFN